MSRPQPTSAQRHAKAKFHNRIKNNPLMAADAMTDAEIADIVGDASVKMWLRDQAFRSWFLDDKVLDDLLTLGAEEAVRKLIEIVTEVNVGPQQAVSSSSQVAAAKLLMEFAGLKPANKTEHSIKAEELPNDEKALREYIARNAKKLKAVKDD